jgi:hypothetical protein
VEVARGLHQDAVALDDLLVARGPAAVRVRGVARVGEAAVGAGPAVHVEDGIRATALDVDPLRVHLPHPPGQRRGVGDEVDLVGEIDAGPVGQQVVDHVVEHPVVRGVVTPAERPRQLDVRLLLAGGEGGPAVDEPDGVVEMQHVDAGDLAVRELEVGAEAGDEARALRARDVLAVERDRVLAGLDRDRPVAVLEVLDARRGRRGGGHEQQRQHDGGEEPGEHGLDSSARRWCTLPFG